MLFIYVLQLENNKYYIGKTINPEFRLNHHFRSSNSEWTKKYKPMHVLELIPYCDSVNEDKHTIKYMKQYGIKNVRGGSFFKLKLDEDNKDIIKKMINCLNDKCYICGENGHFSEDCYQNDNSLLEKQFENLLIDKDLCFRCYRKGHYAQDCYAKKTVTGDEIEELSDEESDDE